MLLYATEGYLKVMEPLEYRHQPDDAHVLLLRESRQEQHGQAALMLKMEVLAMYESNFPHYGESINKGPVPHKDKNPAITDGVNICREIDSDNHAPCFSLVGSCIALSPAFLASGFPT